MSNLTLRLATALIAAVGIIHLYLAPGELGDVAYVGVLFVLAGIGGLAAALPLAVRRSEPWGWLLGALVAAGAFVSFLVSRTVGLPSYKETSWETLGIVSLVCEGAFLVLVVARHAPALVRRATTPVQAAPARDDRRSHIAA